MKPSRLYKAFPILKLLGSAVRYKPNMVIWNSTSGLNGKVFFPLSIEKPVGLRQKG